MRGKGPSPARPGQCARGGRHQQERGFKPTQGSVDGGVARSYGRAGVHPESGRRASGERSRSQKRRLQGVGRPGARPCGWGQHGRRRKGCKGTCPLWTGPGLIRGSGSRACGAPGDGVGRRGSGCGERGLGLVAQVAARQVCALQDVVEGEQRDLRRRPQDAARREVAGLVRPRVAVHSVHPLVVLVPRPVARRGLGREPSAGPSASHVSPSPPLGRGPRHLILGHPPFPVRRSSIEESVCGRPRAKAAPPPHNPLPCRTGVGRDPRLGALFFSET